jgi:hypothetical protein
MFYAMFGRQNLRFRIRNAQSVLSDFRKDRTSDRLLKSRRRCLRLSSAQAASEHGVAQSRPPLRPKWR